MLIETERLRLRPMEMGDLDGFVALHADPEVTRFIHPRDEAEWRERGHGLLAVLDRENGAFLGWALRRDGWGRGYATEAARACIEWGFSELDVPYLTAMINPDNVRSVRVAERLGLTPLRDDMLLGDPVIVYSLDRAD